MTTVLNEIEIIGNGLMKNRECKVRILPSKLGKIRYFVGNSFDAIEANIDNLISSEHCVTLGYKRSKAVLTEHFSAACAFCNIDSLDVYLSEPELPILDGSAKGWIELFEKAGIEKSKPVSYKVKEPIYYLNGKTHLVVLPDNELNISYCVNYDHPDLRGRWVSYNPKTKNEIVEARTFGFLKDLKRFQLFGFAKGVSYENTVGLKDDGYTTELRSELEPAKHKILDLIGDLYLTGVNPLNLKAHIIAKEAGHTVHLKVAKILKNKLVKEK